VLDGKPLKTLGRRYRRRPHTRGHRFLGSSAIPVGNFLDYEKKLQQNGVIVRPSRRQEKIAAELEAMPSGETTASTKTPRFRKLVAYLNDTRASFKAFRSGLSEPSGRNPGDRHARPTRSISPWKRKTVNWRRTSSRSSMWLRTRRESSAPATNASFARASPMRQFFWQADQKCRLGRLLAEARTRHLRIAARELSRQGRTHPRHRPLVHASSGSISACSTPTSRKLTARRTRQVRPRHEMVREFHRATGHRRRALRARSGRIPTKSPTPSTITNRPVGLEDPSRAI